MTIDKLLQDMAEAIEVEHKKPVRNFAQVALKVVADAIPDDNKDVELMHFSNDLKTWSKQ